MFLLLLDRWFHLLIAKMIAHTVAQYATNKSAVVLDICHFVSSLLTGSFTLVNSCTDLAEAIGSWTPSQYCRHATLCRYLIYRTEYNECAIKFQYVSTSCFLSESTCGSPSQRSDQSNSSSSSSSSTLVSTWSSAPHRLGSWLKLIVIDTLRLCVGHFLWCDLGCDHNTPMCSFIKSILATTEWWSIEIIVQATSIVHIESVKLGISHFLKDALVAIWSLSVGMVCRFTVRLCDWLDIVDICASWSRPNMNSKREHVDIYGNWQVTARVGTRGNSHCSGQSYMFCWCDVCGGRQVHSRTYFMGRVRQIDTRCHALMDDLPWLPILFGFGVCSSLCPVTMSAMKVCLAMLWHVTYHQW